MGPTGLGRGQRAFVNVNVHEGVVQVRTRRILLSILSALTLHALTTHVIVASAHSDAHVGG